MPPAAFANAVFAASVVYAPAPTPATAQVSCGNNVVRVDFARKQRDERVHGAVADAKTPQPLWRIVATERLSALRRFADGWDGDGSAAISRPSLAKALRLLDVAFASVKYPAPPVAVPCADGSVQLEWWLTDTRFELSISPDGDLEAWACDRLHAHEIEGDGSLAVELLAKWAPRLTADKLSPIV